MYLVAGLVRMLRGWHRYNEYVNAGVKLHQGDRVKEFVTN